MKNLFKGLIVIGVLIIVGTAGASDVDAISLVRTLLQISLSALLIGVGYIGLQFVKCENKNEARVKINEHKEAKYVNAA